MYKNIKVCKRRIVLINVCTLDRISGSPIKVYLLVPQDQQKYIC